MKVNSVLITGANRGIGLGFVKHFAQLCDPPLYIFATYRNVDTLQKLKNIQESSEKTKLILIKMDVNQLHEIEAAKEIVAKTVGDKGLNLLINNAGICKFQSFPHITQENLDVHFKVHTMGPLLVLQVMLPLLKKAASQEVGNKLNISRAAVLNISSFTASIANTGKVFLQDLHSGSYKISKAALNMAMRVAAAFLKDEGVFVVMMCPGWVKTELVDGMGELEVDESVSTIIQTLEKLDESHQGSFLDRFGNALPF